MYEAISVKMSNAHQPQTPIKVDLIFNDRRGPKFVTVSLEKKKTSSYGSILEEYVTCKKFEKNLIINIMHVAMQIPKKPISKKPQKISTRSAWLIDPKIIEFRLYCGIFY